MGGKREAGTIFISHAHEDAAAADEIADRLARAGLAPWVDRRELAPGTSFVEGVERSLGYASYLLLLLSRDSLDSHWVKLEWMSALASEAIVVVPVLLEACETPRLLAHLVRVELFPDRAAGIGRILDFLRAEIRPVSETALKKLSSRDPGGELVAATPRLLRLVAMRCMNESDLLGFLFDAEIEPGTIGGANLHERLVTLLHTTRQEGLLDGLADWLATEKSRCVQHQLRKLGGEEIWTVARYA